MFIEEIFYVFKELVKNGILLFGLGFLYALNNYGIRAITRVRKVVVGLTIGFIAILVMMFPYEMQPGIFFDTRSVLFSISGLFFGGTTTLVAAIIGIVYRISLGGPGVYSGVATIYVTSLIGIYWRSRMPLFPKWKPVYEYYALGMTASLLTLGCFLLIPNPFPIILMVLPTYILIFPFVSVVLAQIFNIQKERALNHEKIKKQQLLLQATIDALETTEMFSIDKQYCYLSLNEAHVNAMKIQYDQTVAIGQNYLDAITDSRLQSRIRAYIHRAYAGERHTIVFQKQDQSGSYIEESFSPIFDQDHKVIGVTIMAKDVTETKKYEEAILHLSYYDPLTKIPNRRFYDEKLEQLNQPQFYPLSILSLDINGLKIFNDAFGHHVGDELLCCVAQHLQTYFQEPNIVARIGGDEFSVILPNRSYQEAEEMLEAFKQFISSKKIQGVSISISFGLATREEKEVTKSDLEQLSDEDMYIHKFAHSSRNRQRVVSEVLDVLQTRFPYEKEHIEIMKQVMVEMAKLMRLESGEVERLMTLCHLHDIGKIAMDPRILTKSTPLTDSEWNVIKKHPEKGYRILVASLEHTNIALDVFCHHEWWNGQGYPRRLVGTKIPINARLLAIAEAYSALTCPSSYQTPVSSAEAVEKIKDQAGKQFDPALTALFVSLYEQGKIK